MHASGFVRWKRHLQLVGFLIDPLASIQFYLNTSQLPLEPSLTSNCYLMTASFSSIQLFGRSISYGFLGSHLFSGISLGSLRVVAGFIHEITRSLASMKHWQMKVTTWSEIQSRKIVLRLSKMKIYEKEVTRRNRHWGVIKSKARGCFQWTLELLHSRYI